MVTLMLVKVFHSYGDVCAVTGFDSFRSLPKFAGGVPAPERARRRAHGNASRSCITDYYRVITSFKFQGSKVLIDTGYFIPASLQGLHGYFSRSFIHAVTIVRPAGGSLLPSARAGGVHGNANGRV